MCIVRFMTLWSLKISVYSKVYDQGRKKMFSGGGADVCVLICALARGKIFS